MVPAPRQPTAVSCDFDDTVVLENLSDAVYRRFGRGWEPVLADYRAGRISVEESNARIFRTVRAARDDILRFVREHATVRRGFPEFARFCRDAGVTLVINSSGLDLYITEVLRGLGLAGLPVRAAVTRVTPHGLHLSYHGLDGAPLEHGAKVATVRALRERGFRVVHIGDGASDIAPAEAADFVFARSTLLEHCRRAGLPHAAFEDFFDVMAGMRDRGLAPEEGVRSEREGTAAVRQPGRPHGAARGVHCGGSPRRGGSGAHLPPHRRRPPQDPAGK